MQNIFIELLPPWIETGLQPAFYDKESGSVLQQTARMYAKLNEVVSSVNNQNSIVDEFVTKFNELHDYVYDYFENLDVQTEINSKLDKMALDGSLQAILQPMVTQVKNELLADYDTAMADLGEQYNVFTSSINYMVNTIDTKVDSVVSGKPIPVSQTSQMTDSSKTYLLTTDGYWYYYNGTSWVRGGLYQATEIENDSVTPAKTTFAKRSANLIDVRNPNILSAYPANTALVPDHNTRCLYIPCDANTTYTVSRSINTGRFGVAGCSTTPTDSSDINNRVNAFTSYKVTYTTGANDAYLIIYYWNALQAQNTEAEALADLCAVKGDTDGTVIPSYIIEVTSDNINDQNVTTDKIKDEAVIPTKTSFSKISRNIFDYEDAPLLNANINSSVNYIQGAGNTRSTYVACEPNKVYTVSKMRTARFGVATTATTPAIGTEISDFRQSHNATSITITTGANAQYIVIFFYNATYDTTVTPTDILKTMMVEQSATAGTYVDHNIIEVTTDNLNDQSVTRAKLADDVLAMFDTGTLNSRGKIYGVQYNITNSSTACTRIADASSLHNDYVDGSTYQLNNGVNDFDSVFPYSEIKRCNLNFTANGKKIITYEGEEGFALDGSNGNVMVEIPKFYTLRERNGNIETLAITGEPKSGFNVEPAFVVDGKEIDHVYVGVYDASVALNSTVYSYSGNYPKVKTSLNQFVSDFANAGLHSYDFSIYMMLQKLATIEFADRNIQKFMGGITYLPYWYGAEDTEDKINSVGTNYVMVDTNGDSGRLGAFWVGERIRFFKDSTQPDDFTYARNITAVEQIGNETKITYDGSDLSSTIVAGDNIGGCPQINGLTDAIQYHTGRTNYASGNTFASQVNPMKYR